MLLVSLDYPTIAEIRTDKDISLKTQERPSLQGDPVYGQMDARTAPAPVLTTFPNPFDDEEEQGYIPSLLSKFKNTFTPAPTASLVAPIQEQREQATNQHAPASDDIPTKRQSTVPSASTNTRVTQPRTSSATNLTSLRKQATRPTKSSVQSYSSLQSIAPANPSVTKAPPSFSRNFASREIAPPVVSITPVVSVTDAGHATHEEPVAGPSRSVMHAHFSSSTPIQTGSGARYRRPSVSTIPDSPSSASLSGIAANAELSQNFSHVPGFPMADDTRSIRTSGSIKRNGSVSKIIRRLRGEGLSKHYWMADENCKECYDCKSVFTTWRRKHHCRICGQVFCGRCAANIIKGYRFGHEGMVRVCNLCLQIMDEYDDDDDRRSVASASTSHFPSTIGPGLIESSPDLPYVQSPFAASQLFTRQYDPLNSISESNMRQWDSDDASRPLTPDGYGSSTSHHFADGSYERPNPAPFRRGIIDDHHHVHHDDDKAVSTFSVSPPDGDAGAGFMATGRRAPRPESDTAIERAIERTSSDISAVAGGIEFPSFDTDETAPEHRKKRQSSIHVPPSGLRTRLSSRLSQNGLTALLDEPARGDGLWRRRADSTLKRPDIISGNSFFHFHLMLRQAIDREGLKHPEEWERVLSTLLLKVSTHLQPNVRSGDSIDVRTYVKIKKIPGGKISDSEYVDGIVITKNVAHKQMARHLVNPRIMVLTFPLDYHRVENQFMSLEPLVTQEKDYLRLLTKRVIDVRPHIVLVERSASRIALDFLLDANIAVARSVKPSAIHQVARCTQADVIASMDRLALEPRLGRCADFRIQTYEHDLIPGRRKTFMRFEGCQREYGCTLVLRGGDIETLRKVKRVADFMALVVYNLKLEVCLFNDEHNMLPPQPQLSSTVAFERPDADLLQPGLTLRDNPSASPVVTSIERKAELEAQERLSREIQASLSPYLETALSASAAVAFPPPAPLAKMADLDRSLAEMRQKRDEAEAVQILVEEGKVSAVSAADLASSTATLTQAAVPAPEISIPATSTEEPATTEGVTQTSIPSTSTSDLAISPVSQSQTTARHRDASRDPYRILRLPEEIAQDAALAQTEHNHAEQLKLWSWYTKRNKGSLRPEDYQGIVFLYSLVCEGTDRPCVGPQLQSHNYYQADDCTLGQFLEDLTADAVKPCPSKSCERLQLFHFRLLVHGQTRLQIAMDQFACPSPGHEDKIITWSYCRICSTPSPTAILRDETWKISWGAYLEHCFYPPMARAGFSCPHDAYRDQIRYFAHRNLAIRIHNEEIDLYETVRPSIILRLRPALKVALKNQEYESALAKNAAYFDSVLFRLKVFDYDVVQPERVQDLRTLLEDLLTRAVNDRDALISLLNRTYKLTPMTDTLAINTVLRSMQDKVVQWDNDFAEIERTFVPNEKDIRRMTASHLKRLFANQDVFGTMDRNLTSMTVSEVDEKGLQCLEETSKIETSATSSEAAVNKTEEDQVSLPKLDLDLNIQSDDGVTPLAEVARSPLSRRQTNYDSDSTISAVRRSPGRAYVVSPDVRDSGTSGIDGDVHAFISRLPKRSKPAPSIADLVKRFQEQVAVHESSPSPEGSREVERPSSSASGRFASSHASEASDSEQESSFRPRLRRGKTDQSSRRREINRSHVVSDGDSSYAKIASRLNSPTLSKRSSQKTGSALPPLDLTNATAQHQRAARSLNNRATSNPVSKRATTGLTVSSDAATGLGDTKTMLGGKGKAPMRGPGESIGRSPSAMRGRRALACGNLNGSRVSSIARHFDRLSREAERDRQRRISMARGKRARPVGVTKARVQVFSNVRDAYKDEFDTDSSEADNEEDDDMEGEGDSDDSIGKRATPGDPNDKAVLPPLELRLTEPADVPAPVGSTLATTQAMVSPPPDDHPPLSSSFSSTVPESVAASEAQSEVSLSERLQIELPPFDTSVPLTSMPATPQLSAENDDFRMPVSQMSESEMSSGGPERSSILKTLSGLWAFRTGEFSPLEYPLSAAEHVFADSRIIIREDEPTSIIAFTLSSRTHRDKLRNVAHQHRSAKKAEDFMPDEVTTERTSAWDVLSLDEAVEAEDPTRGDAGTHLKYDFESGSSTIFCRVFFAEQFAALRQACGCEDSFIESLARCVKWDSSGGKSGSAFLKTKDDRFIAKEVSRLEMDALTKFAPSYFDYTRKAVSGDRPTVLAKVYGFFKIGYRNATTGRAMRMNVLIMENLFYERRFTKIYDLKGSTRNRLVQPTGRVNEVLLDENLLEIANRHPLYMRDHSKRILRTALFNDTLFLSNLNVMDYSLVVGVDADRRELVVGIVDYIRTFTWDKKLESWVKDSAFLGGAGKGEPTIVTPKQYKARFRAAMEKNYFQSVPDRWTKLDADCEGQMDDDADVKA